MEMGFRYAEDHGYSTTGGEEIFDTRYSRTEGAEGILTTKAQRHEDGWESGMGEGKWWMGYAALGFSSIQTGYALAHCVP